METTKHTQGPWVYTPLLSGSENHKGYHITAIDGNWSHAAVQPGDEDGRLGRANAQLIAAAPELLEALLSFMSVPNDELEGYCRHSMGDAAALASAAINKALGNPEPAQ